MSIVSLDSFHPANAGYRECPNKKHEYTFNTVRHTNACPRIHIPRVEFIQGGAFSLLPVCLFVSSFFVSYIADRLVGIDNFSLCLSFSKGLQIKKKYTNRCQIICTLICQLIISHESGTHLLVPDIPICSLKHSTRKNRNKAPGVTSTSQNDVVLGIWRLIRRDGSAREV